MKYQLVTNQTALDFLNYYEERIIKYGMYERYLPLASMWTFNNGKLALDGRHYECVADKDYGQVLRFVYHVSDYDLIFTVWKYKLGKLNQQPVCFAKNGTIQARLSKPAHKNWHSWLYIDRFLLPVLFISMLITIAIFGWLLMQIAPSLKWYYTLLASLLLLFYGVSTSKFCLKYWRSHKYLKLWLNLTNLANNPNN